MLTIYSDALGAVLKNNQPLVIRATEPAKSLDRLSEYAQQLLDAGIRKGDMLVAIGGGIIQDITCFLAAVMLRGLNWHFYPTTLLAQADSCIGSKSSINVGPYKNVVGSFTPPQEVHINAGLLTTLNPVDLRSGIGEMLKVHAIEGPSSFDRIAGAYEALCDDELVLTEFIVSSLRIKQRLIELDEFDAGPRRVMNYGHSFGHAIESATGFAVPHGIAVSLGMDLANFTAAKLGLAPHAHFERMHYTLARNYQGFEKTEVSVEQLLLALGRDKKNTESHLVLVLPDQHGTVSLVPVAQDARFEAICRDYLLEERGL